MADFASEVPASLLKWVTPDETAAEFFRRQGREAVATGLSFIDAHIKLRPGHILELSGPAGSGKTELIVQMVVNTLCQTVNTQQGAEQEHVVVVDCDGKFDVLRLLQVLQYRGQGVMELVMPRFHLVRCFNTLELLLALNALPHHLSALNGRCRLLLLDNIAAHTWHDKAAVFSATNQQLPITTQQQQHNAQAGITQHQQQPQVPSWLAGHIPAASHPSSSSSSGQGVPGFDALRVQRTQAALLQAVCQQWRVPVVITKHTGVQQLERSGVTKLVQREVLTEPLQAAVSHRLVLMPAGALSLQQQGPGQQGTTVLLQWQTADFTGPLQRCCITDDGVHVVS